jgi:hypothetical protein
MTFVFVLLFLAYGALCLLAPAKHLAFNAWLSRRGRRKWHEHRVYMTLHFRMQRRWSQQTPANLWGLRVTGIAFIGMSLWVMWEYWSPSLMDTSAVIVPTIKTIRCRLAQPTSTSPYVCCQRVRRATRARLISTCVTSVFGPAITAAASRLASSSNWRSRMRLATRKFGMPA